MKVITIGRNPDNDVCINDPYVGRHHCQIVQYDNGTYAIVDMGSTNGTYVNGKRIFGEAQLQPYDTVSLRLLVDRSSPTRPSHCTTCYRDP